MAHSTPETRPSRATRTAGAVVVVATVAVLALVLRAFPRLVIPAAIGAAGSVLLAVTLRLSTGRDRPAAGFGAGLLVAPAGATVIGGVVVAAVLLVEDLFPVSEEALLSVGWLLTVGHVGVVVGCTVAVLGLALAVGDGAVEDRLASGSYVVHRAGAIPAGAALVFLLVALGSGTTADAAIVAPVAGPLGRLLSPAAAVVPDWLLLSSLLALAALLLGAAVERLEARPTAGPPVPHRSGAVAGGALATVTALVAAEWVYARTVAEIIERFPEQIEGQIRETATTVATSYGESTVLLVAAVLCVGVVAGGLFLLRLALALGLLSGDSAGSALASIGLFLAVVFAGTVGAPAWLVVSGVGASLLVWDAGQFGTVLAREAGRRRTRRVELVHLGGTALVGVAATAGALLLVGWLPADPAGPSATNLLALCSVVVGLLSLAIALR